MILDILASLSLVLGTLLMLLAGVGVVRMPDMYTRLSATSKAAPLGTCLILAAAAIASGDPATVARVLGIVLFLALTAPVAAHLLANSAYRVGTPLWSGTHYDAMASGHQQLDDQQEA